MAAELTFVVPFWTNDEKTGLFYLRKTIESVLSQTLKEWRLIVVDDKSPIDGVKKFVEGFNDPRISCNFNDENLGQAGNWNRCVELVDTPFYTILHADDELKSDYAVLMLATIKSRPNVTAVFCNADIIDEHGKPTPSFADAIKKFIRKSGEFELLGDEGLELLLKGNFIMCPTVIYRKSLTAGLQFSRDWKYIPDLYYWCHLLFNDRVLLGIPNVAFRYRRHSQSGTDIGRKSTVIFDEESRFYDLVREKAKVKNWTRSVLRAEKKQIVKLRALYFALKDLASLRVSAAREKLQFLARIGR